jgi:hypothetical protein
MRHSRYRQGVALPAAILLVIAPVVAQGQAPQPSSTTPAPQTSRADATLPAPRAIIDKHIAAVGGLAAILGRSSLHAVGTLAMPATGMTGTVDVFAAKPDKFVLRMNITGIGQVEEGYDGTTGWSMSAMTGPSVMGGKELEQKRFESDFYGDLHADARYESMTTLEKTTFDGRPCYKLRLVRRGGGEDVEFYDVATGLKAGGIMTRETPMGALTATSVETQYRRFGSLLQPTLLKQTAMGVEQVITLDRIEYDNVEPSVFEPPAAIKVLVK